VVLVGARQTGKSTLAQRVGPDRTYLSLDDYKVLERAREDPQALVDGIGRPLTLDEVQRAPQLLLAIKRSVDLDRRPGRFLLTGSANLLLMAGVSESLAGRAFYLVLGPMTEREKRRLDPAPGWLALLQAASAKAFVAGLPPAGEVGWPGAVLEGGLPPVALAGAPEARSAWFEGYVQTYLERDLRQLAQVASLVDFRRLVEMAALRTGGILNQADLARDARLPAATANRYLNLLEVSYQVQRLPAFAVNRTKRLVKSPRLYCGDTGLCAFLAGISDEGTLRASPLAGALLENLLLVQFRAWRETVSPRPEAFYWRTVSGREVDFVVSWKRRLVPIEVKASTRVGPSDAEGLAQFLEEYGKEAPFGVLVYGGREAFLLSERIAAVPLGAWV
jgi:predicted AAA+ superfamily ATPase